MAIQLTPLMQQYVDIKKQYQDALLLFQVGDFYELFFEDAQKAAAFLGITLTSRNKQDEQAIPLCGVPVHALDYYLIKLVKGGFHVAVCDQLEEATPGKMVKRGITRVFTPATLTDERMLDPKTPSYLLIFAADQQAIVLIFLELLTGTLSCTQIKVQKQDEDHKKLLHEVAQFCPDEIIYAAATHNTSYAHYLEQQGYAVCEHTPSAQSLEFEQWIEQQFGQPCARELMQKVLAREALNVLYQYVNKHQPTALSAIRTCTWYHMEQYAIIDDISLRNLEILKNNYDNTTKHTLFSVMDGAITAMGSRMIRKWLARPLLDVDQIYMRQQVIKRFAASISLHVPLQHLLKSVGDLERVVGRIALQKAPAHDYIALSRVLKLLPQFQNMISAHRDLVHVHSLLALFLPFHALTMLLDNALYDNGSLEWIIKSSFDESLARVRALVEHSNEMLLAFERAEQERTGIHSLKVRFNQVQGYYIEITKTHVDRVPDDYVRSQSLVGRERYTCAALKKLAAEIISARAHAESIEKELFESVKNQVYTYIPQLRSLAYQLAQLDALFGLSLVAYKEQYVCPAFSQHDLIIKHGRHPVVEKTLAQPFIANDIYLNEHDRMMIITGPNMGGKSTYLRQVALIAILAQCGSFVPAQNAILPIFDRFFTRIGAGDQLAQGKSTFLVEMSETATICAKATANSLIILDEVGRGTSTYDGLALAHAIAFYIHEKIKAKTLFATHYHELATLAQKSTGIKNFHAASKKTEHGILLLHTIMPGAADGSFGIEIAQQAQLPIEVINHARELLQELEVV